MEYVPGVVTATESADWRPVSPLRGSSSLQAADVVEEPAYTASTVSKLLPWVSTRRVPGPGTVVLNHTVWPLPPHGPGSPDSAEAPTVMPVTVPGNGTVVAFARLSLAGAANAGGLMTRNPVAARAAAQIIVAMRC